MKHIIDSFPNKLPLTAQGQYPKRKWFGWGQSPSSLAQALLQSVEELFNAVSGDTPEIKKNNILQSVGIIYDSYIAKALPLSLAPVNPLIRYLVVSLIVPQILDWLIAKEQTVGMQQFTTYVKNKPFMNRPVEWMQGDKLSTTNEIMLKTGKEPIIADPDLQMMMMLNNDGTVCPVKHYTANLKQGYTTYEEKELEPEQRSQISALFKDWGQNTTYFLGQTINLPS
jgi:hypothetical protein